MSAEELVSHHQPTLDTALTAIRTRGYFSAYPESPSPRVYGETAAPAGQDAFDAYPESPSPRVYGETAAPARSQSICHGTMFAWCSRWVRMISSPAPMNLRP